MQVEKRKRENSPETPSGGLWDHEEFVERYREMADMTPPRIKERVNTDYGFELVDVVESEHTWPKSESDPESESGSGSGSGSTLKSEPGAGPDTVALPKTSYGGAMRPIDVELDDAEKKLAIAKAKFEGLEYEVECAKMAQQLENLKRGGAPFRWVCVKTRRAHTLTDSEPCRAMYTPSVRRLKSYGPVPAVGTFFRTTGVAI